MKNDPYYVKMNLSDNVGIKALPHQKTNSLCAALPAGRKDIFMKYYPLTAAQNMHWQWIREYGTQQVSGVSIVASMKAPMDFELLKKCILEEYGRYECMRLRFTKPDRNGVIKQYISKEIPEDIRLADLTGEGTLSGADAVMQQWAYQTFDGDNVPMCEIRMVELPEGYRGMFVHMDHRLVDSSALGVMVSDIFRLYMHYQFGSAKPAEPASFAKVLERDLARASEPRRLEKDRRFWSEHFDTYGEPLYSDIQGKSVLEEARKRHNDPDLRAADIERKELFVTVKDYYLEPKPTKRLLNFCTENNISMTNLILFVMRTYLSKVNDGQEDITIENFISRRSTHDEWSSGGSRTIMFPCRTIIRPETEFLEALYLIQQSQNQIYMHGNYDPAFIREEEKRRYGTPDDTGYVSCYLTYQPMMTYNTSEKLKNIPMHINWFANGAATKKMYLTVSPNEKGEMKFSFHYQTVKLDEHDIELMYYYMMRILFMGIEDSHITVGEMLGRA